MKVRSMSKALKMRGLKLTHLFISEGLFILCWRLYYNGRYTEVYHLKGDLILYALYATLLFLMNRTYDGYSVGYRKEYDNTYSQTLAAVITAGIIWAISLLMYMKLTNPLPLLGLCLVQFLWNITWCLTAKKAYSTLHIHQKTVVIYDDDKDLDRLEEIGQLKHKFIVQKYIKNPQDYKELEKELKEFEAVVISGVNATLRNRIVKYCIETRTLVYFAPHVDDIIIQGASHMRYFSVPILSVRRAEPTLEYLFLKRTFDIVMSALGLIVLSPFIGITALAVKLYDHGPVIYKQVRLTKDRKEFIIFKFRSMSTDAEIDGVARLSTGENDNRITPVGKIIRACRADELPQLWNILMGSMSIVGPRPERPDIFTQYEEEIPAFSLRLQVKAGLTGYAQVYGKYNTNPYDKLEMDLMYINKMSFVEDLRLIFATVRVLFMKGSTEGIEAEKTTALV